MGPLSAVSSKAPRNDLCPGPSLLSLGRKGLKLQEGEEKGRREKGGKKERKVKKGRMQIRGFNDEARFRVDPSPGFTCCQ